MAFIVKKGGGFSFGIDGAQEMERALEGMSRAARGQILGSAIRASAAVLRNEARRLAPRKSGTLRKSIAVRVNRRERHAVSMTMGLRPDGFYGRFIELGTSTQSAQPFMRPALQAKGRESIDAFRRKFWERLRVIAARQ